MDTRKKETIKKSDLDAGLLITKTPNLSLRKTDRSVTFKLPKNSKKRDSQDDDLPDITPELMQRLDAMWNMENVYEERPMREFVNAVREHLDAINPYLEILKENEKSWYECWRFLYKIAQELDYASELSANDKFYFMPESLRQEELSARLNLANADAEWDVVKNDYIMDVEKLREDIVKITNKLKDISSAKDLYILQMLDVTKPAIAGAQSTGGGCISNFFALFGGKRASQSAIVTPVLVKPEDSVAKIIALRERLLREQNAELEAKNNELNKLAGAEPPRKDQYRNDWNAIKAKIMHDQIESYRCQTKGVMLHSIRLYVLAIRTYFLIYGENPLAKVKTSLSEAKQPIRKISGNSDVTAGKAKALFRQMVRGMKSNLSLFYCLQPDRCYFNEYLENYNRISDTEQRDAILAGIEIEESLNRIFPQFESPEVNLGMRK
jgi:hypothetical protein